MKKFFNEAFSIALAIYVIFGIVTVAGQVVGIITGNGDLAAYISETIQTYAVIFSGICACISFIYIIISKDAFKTVKD